MEREQVIYIMKYYKDIDRNIKFNQRIIKEYEDVYYSPTVTPSYTGGIHGKGDISTPVERMILSIPQDIERHTNILKKEIQQYREEKIILSETLNRLDFVQKTVLYRFYVNGHSWAKIASELNYSQSNCRKLRDKALEALGVILNGNRIKIKILERMPKSSTQ